MLNFFLIEDLIKKFVNFDIFVYKIYYIIKNVYIF